MCVCESVSKQSMQRLAILLSQYSGGDSPPPPINSFMDELEGHHMCAEGKGVLMRWGLHHVIG